MKKSYYWVRGAVAVGIVCMLLAVGCGFWMQKNKSASGQSEVPEISGTFGVSADTCTLCSNILDLHKGEDNLGILYMMGGELFYVEINRYDASGKLIEKPAGYMSMDTLNTKEGMKTTLTVNSDRGYARAKICFDSSNKSGDDYGIGLINFKTEEVKLLGANIRGFMLGDYYVSCSAGKGENGTGMELEIVMFYCPERYIENR